MDSSTQANLIMRLYKMHNLRRTPARDAERAQIGEDFNLDTSDITNWFRPALKGLRASVQGKKRTGYQAIRTLHQLMSLIKEVQKKKGIIKENYKDHEISQRIPYDLFDLLRKTADDTDTVSLNEFMFDRGLVFAPDLEMTVREIDELVERGLIIQVVSDDDDDDSEADINF